MSGFPELIAAAKTAGTEQWLPDLVALGVTTPKLVLLKAKEIKAMGMPDSDYRALLIPLKGVVAARPDIPVAQPSQGGSLNQALAAAQPNERAKSLASLEQDVYAKNNHAPQESRMKTWTKIAAAWGKPPLPLTADLIKSVGASFKAGGYRSAHLYFGTAKKQHVLQYGALPSDLEVVIGADLCSQRTSTKQYAIECIRQVLKAAALPTTREGVQGQVEMYHGHALRVSGAQYLTRMGLSTTLVMLLGRWGSQAILRYIQDSPLQELLQARGPTALASGSDPAPREVPVPRALEDEPAFKKLKADQAEVSEELAKLRAIHTEIVEDMARINYVPAYVVGRKTHLPDPREKHLNPRSWTTKCGWSYGMTKFRRTDEPGDQCKKCFNIERKPGQAESGEDTPSSSSSDSS